ncbi:MULTISPECIES: hypothetical protein [Pseudomonas]|uniref:hypothetical protein n=1 Tax=Pseudomonas TaxID=286 RepID=UPI0007AF669C|nr:MULTISPECIES: hypothetical protein [Pseudomonas]
MTANQAVPIPKSAWEYGTYNWHLAWTVDVVNREATHRSGLVFDFTAGAGRDARPPLGGRCPCGAWYGELRGGAETLVGYDKERIAVRLCLEALQLFSDTASFACQDCPEDTLGGDYYMVHNALWDHVNPNIAGMLCLPCLEIRVGRRLQPGDFTDAPINSPARIAEFCADDAQLDAEDDCREYILDQIRESLGMWRWRLTLWRWRILVKQHSQPTKTE